MSKAEAQTVRQRWRRGDEYEMVYADETGQLEGRTEGRPDPQGYATLDEFMRATYAHGDE